jgi:hypothetical protein
MKKNKHYVGWLIGIIMVALLISQIGGHNSVTKKEYLDGRTTAHTITQFPQMSRGSFCMPSGSVPTVHECFMAMQNEANPCPQNQVPNGPGSHCTTSGQACFGSGGAGFMCNCVWLCTKA